MKKLLKFSASWCGPCQMLKMTMAGEDFGIEVEEIDIDKSGDIAAQYAVRGVPTLVLIEDGKEIARKSGAMPLSEIKEFISAAS